MRQMDGIGQTVPLIGYQVLTDGYGSSATALEKRVPEIQEFVEPGN